MCTRLYFPIGIHPSPLLQSRQDLPAKSRRSIVHAISRSMSSSTFVSHSSRNFEKNLQVESRRGSNRSRVRGRSAKARERVGFFTAPRGPPVVHFLSVSLEFATISNLRVFVAGFLEVEVQWTSDDDLFESSRLDPGWFLWSLFFLSIRFYWSEDVGDVSAHEYRRLNMRQFSSCALWFDMWT